VTNLPLAILVTGSGALLAYSGIVNPAGGLVAQIGHVLRGEALATSASAPAVTVVDPSANMPGGTTYDSQIPAAARGSGAGVVAAAQTWLGVPYRFGGTTRAGVDCSGFTENVYATVGVNLPRTAALQQVSSKGHHRLLPQRGARRPAVLRLPGLPRRDLPRRRAADRRPAHRNRRPGPERRHQEAHHRAEVRMTDTAGAQSFVLTSLVVSGALAVVKDAATKQLPPIRLGIGLAFTGLTLATLAQFAPALASAFAALLLVSSVFVYGGPALSAITATLPKG
jgi:hypothetical protein